jgi:hypothetical protein
VVAFGFTPRFIDRKIKERRNSKQNNEALMPCAHLASISKHESEILTFVFVSQTFVLVLGVLTHKQLYRSYLLYVKPRTIGIIYMLLMHNYNYYNSICTTIIEVIVPTGLCLRQKKITCI